MAGLSLRRTGFNPRPDHVRFVVDAAAPGQNFLPALRCSLVSSIPQMLHLARTMDSKGKQYKVYANHLYHQSHRLSANYNLQYTNTNEKRSNIPRKSDVWLTVHRNSVWIRKTNYMSLFVFFISLPIVAQHVSGNHVPIIRS